MSALKPFLGLPSSECDFDPDHLYHDHREADALRDMNRQLYLKVERLTVESERLRAALTRYGRHQLLCSFFKDGPHQASPETICDCGLVAAQRQP